MNAILILSGIVIFYFLFMYKKVKGEVTAGEPFQYVDVDMNVVSAVQKNYFDLVNNIPKKYVGNDVILGLICVESGSLIKAGNDSTSIVGDNGNSLGIMQIQQPALADTNKWNNNNYQFVDLKIDAVNVEVGVSYLEGCYQKAISEGSQSPMTLALRKYNSGINNAKDSNTISQNYANKVLSYSQYFS